MRLLVLSVIFLLLLVACSPGSDATDLTQSAATLPPSGTVVILLPPDGAVLYSEAMFISGTAQGLPPEGFRLRVVTASDDTLSEQTITPEGGNWQVELVHDYTGDPTEITIYALPLDGEADYDIQSALLSSLEYRPDGLYGSIITPGEDQVMGGDFIPITGVISGVTDRQITVTLEHDGEVIGEDVITLDYPYPLDELRWEADLPTAEHTGPAQVILRAVDPETGEVITLDTVDIMVSVLAG